MSKRCLEAGCRALAVPGYSRCLIHERATYRPYNLNAYRQWRRAHTCDLCGSANDLTRDHIIPVSKGGTSHPDNLRTLCRPCNSSKGRTEDALATALDEGWAQYVAGRDETA